MAMVKGRVHYISKKGSVEMVAEAIARQCKMTKEPLPPAYMPEGVVIMFLGIEGKKADKVMLEFVKSMDSKRVANVALFSANPSKSDAAFAEVKALFKERHVNVLDKTFVCTGKGLFGSHPSQADLDAAAKFAEECINDVLNK